MRIAKEGFTLVETMVSISIAGILLSLTLLGVQQAIEASRRSQHLPSGGWSRTGLG